LNTTASETNFNNGRKCIYPYQCKSRICDEETNSCKGREAGESCSDHVECDKALACRPSNLWPYETQCLPMSDVGSLCETEFDCKPRNFCWKKRKGEASMCLEKHSAPDKIEFMWDSEKYPEITKEAVMIHGQYCQSGIAMKVDETTAKCTSITKVMVADNAEDETPAKQLPIDGPYSCTPNGETVC